MKKELSSLALILILLIVFPKFSSADYSPIISNIKPEIYICEGDSLSYYVNITDKDGDKLDINLSKEYPFKFMQISQSIDKKIYMFKLASTILSKREIGFYQETLYASDGKYVDSKQFNITIIEKNNAPQVQKIGVQTFQINGNNKTFRYKVVAYDIEDKNQDYENLKFNLTFLSGKPFLGIDQNGTITGIIDESLIGVYNLSVCVADNGINKTHPDISLCGQDGKPISVCENFSLTLTNENRPPAITLNQPENLTISSIKDNNLTFKIFKYDPDKTIPDSYWYLDSNLKKYIPESSFDTFECSLPCKINESHTIKVVITDGLLNDSLQWDISIKNCQKDYKEPETPPETEEEEVTINKTETSNLVKTIKKINFKYALIIFAAILAILVSIYFYRFLKLVKEVKREKLKSMNEFLHYEKK